MSDLAPNYQNQYVQPYPQIPLLTFLLIDLHPTSFSLPIIEHVEGRFDPDFGVRGQPGEDLGDRFRGEVTVPAEEVVYTISAGGECFVRPPLSALRRAKIVVVDHVPLFYPPLEEAAGVEWGVGLHVLDDEVTVELDNAVRACEFISYDRIRVDHIPAAEPRFNPAFNHRQLPDHHRLRLQFMVNPNPATNDHITMHTNSTISFDLVVKQLLL